MLKNRKVCIGNLDFLTWKVCIGNLYFLTIGRYVLETYISSL